MALSDEWEEMHLTPGGWVQGSVKRDLVGTTNIARPADAVQTVRKSGVIAAGGAPYKSTEEETDHTQDSSLIERLRDQFGAPTFQV